MRKRVYGKTLSRSSKGRVAMTRALLRALFGNKQVVTTRPKAKFVRAEAEKIVSLVRKGDLTSRRAVSAMFENDREMVEKIYKRFSGLAKERDSGFLKMEDEGVRRGDNARMARLEWIEVEKGNSRKNKEK